ncbi:MAG: tail fiber domain-containing protein, partial [Bacteroidetes bacterium]|nr:tail fiber domain-containing protein [Bacteroidota bacterium]
IRVETNPDEDFIRFDTKGTERMVIDSTGNLGIGITTPSAPLHVIGNIRTSSSLLVANDYIEIGSGTIKYNPFGLGGSLKFQIGSMTTMEIDDAGFIGMGTSPQFGSKLRVGGKITANGLSLNKFDLISGQFHKYGSAANEGDVYIDDYELKLVNSGQANWSIRNDAATGRFEIANTSASAVPGVVGTNRLVVLPNGNTGIGTNSPDVKFQVGENGDGTIARANAWNTFSDLRWKTDIEEIDNPLEKINALNGYYYKWKEGEDQSTQLGLIAQEVEAVLPEIVSNDENGYKSVDYSKLSALFIEGIQEQQRVIERKEEEIEELKVAFKAVLERLEKLENH